MFVELGIIHELDRFPDRTPYVVIIAGPCRRRRKVSTEEVEVKESAKRKKKKLIKVQCIGTYQRR